MAPKCSTARCYCSTSASTPDFEVLRLDPAFVTVEPLRQRSPNWYETLGTNPREEWQLFWQHSATIGSRSG
jgi:hypothetical protein